MSPSGNDGSDGLTPATAWQTLTFVTGRAFAPGDTVLLQGGATFTGCFTFSGTNIHSTADAPFTLSAFGTGVPTIAAGCTGSRLAALSILGINGFYLHNVKLVGNAGGAQYGVFINNPTASVTDWVRVEGCDISGFYTTAAPDYGAEIFVNGIPGGLNRVLLLNNSLHGGQGPTSPDDNGVTGYGNGPNITNVLYQGNVVFDIGGKPGGANGAEGNGLLANGVTHGIIQNNVAYNLGRNSNTCGGPAGIWAYASNDVTIQFNEAYGSGPSGSAGAGCDWNGFDLDGNVTNSVMQYNYSHDNFGAGFLAYIAGTWSGNTIRYNISENDARGGGASVFLAGYAATTGDLAIYGNTFYTSQGHTFGVGVPGGGNVAGHINNNIFFSDHGGKHLIDVAGWNTANVSGLAFLGNDYFAADTFVISAGSATYGSLADWAAASGQEKDGASLIGRQVDPMLQGPGRAGVVGGYRPDLLGGELLQASSPLVGTGVDLGVRFGIDAGSRDFFGATVPNGRGTGFNVGADGSHH